MIKHTLIISFLLISLVSFAQNDNKIRDVFDEETNHLESYKGLELGFNVTNVLSRFVGNSPGTDSQDFPFLLRYHMKNSAFRFGIGASFNRSSFFDATTTTFRETEERGGVASIGFERNVNIRKRLSFYYGLDLFAAIEYESVETSNFSNSKLVKDIMRFGAGPFLGLSYSINHRVRLHTETNVAGFYEQTKTIEEVNSLPIPIADTDRISGSISPPIALFINLKF